MKTNIKVKVNGEYCRVKLDSNKFPYIIIGNEKIILNKIDFPRKVKTVIGLMDLELEIIEGLDELKTILENPELTSDKLSLKQQFRLA